MSGPTILPSLSEAQQDALDRILGWWEKASSSYSAAVPEFKLAGTAGSGKSTLLHYLLGALGGVDVAVLTPTGKAASVLWRKGVAASTIHSHVYAGCIHHPCLTCGGEPSAEEPCSACGGRGREREPTWLERNTRDLDLIIVDEASMVGGREHERLLEQGTPILWVGDPAQLRPINRDPKIMHTPDVMLTHVHRTERPTILDLATDIREGRPASGPHVRRLQGATPPLSVMMRASVVVCARNENRARINEIVRAELGRSGFLPAPGDRVICLQNAIRAERLVNGDTATVLEVGSAYWSKRLQEEIVELEVEMEWGRRRLRTMAPVSLFGVAKYPAQLPRMDGVTCWDYAYAVTGHKAQGSEWPLVAVMDDTWAGVDRRRWLYTAVTRASDGLGLYMRRAG